jgi:hypothetical protein
MIPINRQPASLRFSVLKMILAVLVVQVLRVLSGRHGNLSPLRRYVPKLRTARDESAGSIAVGEIISAGDDSISRTTNVFGKSAEAAGLS